MAQRRRFAPIAERPRLRRLYRHRRGQKRLQWCGAFDGPCASGRVHWSTFVNKRSHLARWREDVDRAWLRLRALLALVLASCYLGALSDNGARDLARTALLPPRGEICRSQRRADGACLSRLCAVVQSHRAGWTGAPLVRSRRWSRAAQGDFPRSRSRSGLTRTDAAGKQGYIRRRMLPEEANRVQDIGDSRWKCRWKTTATIRKDRWPRMCSAMSPPMARAACGHGAGARQASVRSERRAARPSPCRSIPACRARSRTNCAAG